MSTNSLYNSSNEETCPGGLPLTDGKCPELSCTGRSSCSFHGNCNSDSSECECDVGYSGSDCSFDLKGKKKYMLKE